jgi:hypothetical protein
MRSVFFVAAFLVSPLAFADAGSFTFLPPLVPGGTPTVGNVDASAQPVLDIVDLAPPVKGEPFPYSIEISGADVRADGNHFSAHWKVPVLPPADMLRFTVKLDKTELGHVDVLASTFAANQTVPVQFFFNGCLRVTCRGANECHVAAVCNPFTFACSNPPITCPPPIDACHASACDEDLGVCSHPVVGNQYPSGPYGINVGDTIANFSWDGFIAGNHTTVSLADEFQHPDADVLVITQCALWCGPCQQEDSWLKARMPGWNGRVQVLDALADGNIPGIPPTVTQAHNFDVVLGPGFDVAIDPNHTFFPFDQLPPDQQGYPVTIVVNNRNMKITYIHLGFDDVGLQAAIDDVLANPAPAPMCAPL